MLTGTRRCKHYPCGPSCRHHRPGESTKDRRPAERRSGNKCRVDCTVEDQQPRHPGECRPDLKACEDLVRTRSVPDSIDRRDKAGFASGPGCSAELPPCIRRTHAAEYRSRSSRSEEHTSELQSLAYLVCRLLLEK